MKNTKEQKQKALDNAGFLSNPEKKALDYYLDCHGKIGFIQKHYPSLLIKL